MLLDVLGIFVGFAAVMLLLSLIVTTLVQFLQHLLGLRPRNLRAGVQALLEKVLASKPGEQRQTARKVLDAARIVPRHGSWLGKLLGLLTAPGCTWIKAEELVRGVDGLGIGLTPDQEEGLRQGFERMEDYLRARFLQYIRAITVIVAFLVAFLFQVSAPELLQILSTDPVLRARYVAEGVGLARGGQPALTGTIAYQDVSDEALRTLQERHPDLAAQLEQAAGTGEHREDLVGELGLILAGEAPDRREAIVEEYERLLTELNAARAGQALSEGGRFSEALARFDIIPWSEGWAYYTRPQRFENWIGVIVTAVLLALGAPFWFNMLRSLVNLRDQLQPQDKPDSKEGEE